MPSVAAPFFLHDFFFSLYLHDIFLCYLCYLHFDIIQKFIPFMMMRLRTAVYNCLKVDGLETQESLILEHDRNISLIDQYDFKTLPFAI